MSRELLKWREINSRFPLIESDADDGEIVNVPLE